MLAVSASSVNEKICFHDRNGSVALEHITVIVTLMTFMPGTVSWFSF